MKSSVDYGFDDHPADGDRPRCGWVVAITDDCDECGDARVDVMIEEGGRAARGHPPPGGGRTTTEQGDVMGTKQRLNSYRFRSVWLIGAPPADVFAVLEVTE